jgi:hypothetical protein
MEAKQRVMIAAEAFRRKLSGNGIVEHAAYGNAADSSRFDTKADDANSVARPSTMRSNSDSERVGWSGC